VVKILDMGLALLSEAHSPDAKGLTNTGQMMGTLDYMAPEQGGDSHVVDIRADIYSLNATLY
jgi:serine/threonine protein kinase